MKFVELVRKEQFLLMRRRKFLAMVLLLPIILAGIFAMSSTLSSLKKIDIAVCDLDGTDATAQMKSSLSETFTVHETCDMVDGIRSGEVLLGIEIAQGFSTKLSSLQQAPVTLYYDNSKPQLAATLDYLVLRGMGEYRSSTLAGAESEMQTRTGTLYDQAVAIQGAVNATVGVIPQLAFVQSDIQEFIDTMNLLRNMDVAFLSEPVMMVREGIYTNSDPLAVSFVIVFCILTMFNSFMLCSTNVIFDRENNFVLRLRTSGTWFPTYLLSKLVVFTAVTVVQFGLVFLIFLLQGAQFSINITAMLAVFLVISSLDILIGVLIGTFSENETLAILTALLLTLPFLFLSGIFFPTELFPDAIRLLTDIFPLNIQVIALKKVMMFGFTVSELGTLFNTLLLYTAAAFVGCWLMLRRS
jgi:ABC-type multidrug transport system permease subunit